MDFSQFIPTKLVIPSVYLLLLSLILTRDIDKADRFII